jgi:cytochrome c oxidase subunit 2
MSETTAPGHGASYGLGRWLAGGLASGAAILGLMIGAYAIGYHRGQHRVPAPAAVATTSATTTAPATSSAGAVTVTPALVARGRSLYSSDGCAACHSLTGASGVGPALNGVAGRSVTLADGSTVTADVSYLEESITNADAKIVKGYRSGVMPAAVASFGLGQKPADVRALVAFIESSK